MLDITYYRAIKPPSQVALSFLGYENHLMKTTLYVDGYNLYYGLLRNTPYKWLV